MAWFNYGKSYEQRGKPAEELFGEIAQREGWSLERATRYEDMNEHWDWLMQKGLSVYRTDVKSHKRIYRYDERPSDDFVWVEFKNGAGRPGWLYGKADLISFEFGAHLLLCWREPLRQYAESMVDFSKIGNTAEVGKIMQRTMSGRHDQTTIVPVVDLLSNGIYKEVWAK